MEQMITEFKSQNNNQEQGLNQKFQVKEIKKIQNKQIKYRLKIIEIQNNLVALKTIIKNIPIIFLAFQGWQETTWEHLQNWFYDNKSESFENLRQQCNLYFLSHDGKLMLAMNRSLLDPGLNYDHFISEKDEREEAREYLKQVSESNEYDVSNSDLSTMQEILSRQKKILINFGQLQQVNKEIKQFIEKPNLKNIYNLNQYAIILCHGGYFALGIFDKRGLCIYHKSDHKYVKRGKQGQRQITKDSNAGSNVKSMGSQIRRDQEKKLQINVSSILNDAFQILEACDILFLQAPGINQQLLVSGQEPLFKLQHKLRSICLTAKKATYTEVERIHKALNQIWVVQRIDKEEDQQFF